MAFATSNLSRGSAGDSWVLRGKFTASKGDADGTVTVGGALVHRADFWDTSISTPSQSRFPVKVSTNTTTGISTITVNCSSGATDGRFEIVYR